MRLPENKNVQIRNQTRKNEEVQFEWGNDV